MYSFVASTLWLITPPQPAQPKELHCMCETIRQTDGFCEMCKVGYLAGVKIVSPAFFEALDAHGHDIDVELVRCESCKKALESDGFCEETKIGFVNKKAYFSRMTHLLARGKLRTRASISCTVCLKNTEKTGWCESCQVGMVGFHAYKNRAEFDRLARLRELLVVAIEEANRCITCAMAIINDATCLSCKLTFSDGKRTPLKSP